MGTLHIKNPGLLTTVQDIGRVGYQQFGISMAGAMDQYSLQYANMLVDNDREEACLEITMMGPTIAFDFYGAIAITGGNINPTINGKKIAMYKTIYVNAGDVLSFSGLVDGARAYLAIAGGFKINPVMGSKSTYLRAGIGGFDGRKLKANDVIEVNEREDYFSFGIREIPAKMRYSSSNSVMVRVIMGQEQDRFTNKGIKDFFENEYKLSSQCDRMGYRLEGGEAIEHKDGADIISGGITLGAVQVPAEGQPIIMMSDRQTTGGYTKIANVITSDIALLAQLKPGCSIRFKEITVDEAHAILREKEQEIIELMGSYKEREDVLVKKVNNYYVSVNEKQYNISVKEL